MNSQRRCVDRRRWNQIALALGDPGPMTDRRRWRKWPSEFMRRALLCTLLLGLCAVAEPRPRLLGLAHITVRVADLNAARRFYGDLLGYQEAFTIRQDRSAIVGGGLPQDQVAAVFFKINNRQ